MIHIRTIQYRRTLRPALIKAWCLISILASYSITATAFSAELIIIEEAGCVYCARFNAEIAPAYPNTEEGKLAPLRRVDLANEWPADLSNITPETITPTFILVDNQREVDRMYGYQGDEFFWYLLGQMLAKLEPATSEAKP